MLTDNIEQVTDLYRELAMARVQEAVQTLQSGADTRLLSQGAEAIEEAAAVLACITAIYATPGGELARRWEAQLTDLVALAASLEQVADASHHPGL